MTTIIYGLQVTLVGMLVVFFGLVLLIACIKVMQMIMDFLKKDGKGESSTVETVSDVIETEPEVEEDAGELVAAITAAIAAMLADSQDNTDGDSGNGFVVRAIRRVHNAPAWNKAGREEQVYSRL